MRILIVSRCSKNALTETRRIVDQFAERCGDCVWQTHITKQGLDMLRQLLKKTARRNTSVACHWLRGYSVDELLWIVGDASRFNDHGQVPTNSTHRDILKSGRENSWNTLADISLLVSIAALFHDFGKANSLFQNKLQPSSKDSKMRCEPYRHEWVSLRLFEAFVGNLTDQQWLKKLSEVSKQDEKALLELVKNGEFKEINPFKMLPPLARVIGWLIISHHRLPYWDGIESDGNSPRLGNIKQWLTHSLEAAWNSPQHKWAKAWEVKHMKAVWCCPKGTPMQSPIWQGKAQKIALRALERPHFIKDWLSDDPFTIHVARMILMLADHHYSAEPPTKKWQESIPKLYANTDRETGKCKQQLAEHVIGVAHYASRFVRQLPTLRSTLPAITRHKAFKRRAQASIFHWQDKAYDLAVSIRERTSLQGFFGVNMASTGCGKTLANARIMYGLACDRRGCRFNIALGLRTLTLQTGDALRERLNLNDEDLAVLIGSGAVKALHDHRDELSSIEEVLDQNALFGSESSEDLFYPSEHVRYEGTLDDGILSKWLRKDNKLHKLVSAPIVVSTIDHLVGATESQRGGKQIAPMLRLLTSDLVIDEPDDFELDDFPALSRLVHWAGMLGSRVLLSSATLPPDLVHALFDAYQTGWKEFRKSCLETGIDLGVCAAWFDETGCRTSECCDSTSFMENHREFVDERIKHLQKQPPLRRGQIVPIASSTNDKSCASSAERLIAKTIHESILKLHHDNAMVHPTSGKRLSFGLVRMANINPLVAVAKTLLQEPSPNGYQIHYLIYHSRHPLVIRSSIERLLDQMLKRHNPTDIWNHPVVAKAMSKYATENHVFVVIASPVAEVGRDHDYDWAIAEPSSMRSIVQIAGRIQRHRQYNENKVNPNLHILDQNYRALRQNDTVFCQPGFESECHKIHPHQISQILVPEQYEKINSTVRIKCDDHSDPASNLAAFEHSRIRAKLLREGQGKEYAALWWNEPAHWSYEIQRRMPFRKSSPQEDYFLGIDDENDENPKFHFIDDNGPKCLDESFKRTLEFNLGRGVSYWQGFSYTEEICRLADLLDLKLSDACQKFGRLKLYQSQSNPWQYHPMLGVHKNPS